MNTEKTFRQKEKDLQDNIDAGIATVSILFEAPTKGKNTYVQNAPFIFLPSGKILVYAKNMKAHTVASAKLLAPKREFKGIEVAVDGRGAYVFHNWNKLIAASVVQGEFPQRP